MSIKLTPQTVRTAILTAKQFSPAEALESGMVDQVVDAQNSELFVKQCVRFGQQLSPLAHNRDNYVRLKMDLYYPAVRGFDNYSGLSKL